MAIPGSIQDFISQQADAPTERYDDLRAVVFDGTLKPHQTDRPLAFARGILDRLGVRVDEVRTVDHEIPPGVWPDMREHGYPADDFPGLHRRLVAPADLVILAGPMWPGDQSSMTRKVIERLSAYSSEADEHGQRAYSGKVGGVVPTGNQNGGEHMLHALQHIGLAVPPQADAYRVGETGPGPSSLGAGWGGPRYPGTNRDAVVTIWSLLRLARRSRTAVASPLTASGSSAAPERHASR
jgi:multimeric flavodoxin WrbA